MSGAIKNIVFDLGGVLIDWNPRYLYRKIFTAKQDMEDFLTAVCTQEWNEKQDAGRSFAEGVLELVAKFPHFQEQIHAYDRRWEEMLAGPIAPTVRLLERIEALGRFRLLALSNWSKDKFPIAVKNYEFLKKFEAIVVSGQVGLKKPDVRIFQHLCHVQSIRPQESLFIDDSLLNIRSAENLGFQTVHFLSPEQLQGRLVEFGIL